MSDPVEFYPTPIEAQPISSSRSNGSFGPVFVVLAVIIVVSAAACVLGRLCSRRRRLAKEAQGHTKAKKQGHAAIGPKEWEPTQKPSFNVRDHGDLEFGFDHKKVTGPKMAAKGGGGGGAKGKQSYNGGGRMPEFRFSDDI